MGPHRWPKLLLNATSIIHDYGTQLRWKWLNSIKHILCDHGMDLNFPSIQSNNPRWVQVFKRISAQPNYDRWYQNVCSKSSLNYYVQFKTHPYTVETHL